MANDADDDEQQNACVAQHTCNKNDAPTVATPSTRSTTTLIDNKHSIDAIPSDRATLERWRRALHQKTPICQNTKSFFSESSKTALWREPPSAARANALVIDTTPIASTITIEQQSKYVCNDDIQRRYIKKTNHRQKTTHKRRTISPLDSTKSI
jgi:hypothetical protein